MSRSKKMKQFLLNFYTALFCEENNLSTREGIQKIKEIKEQLQKFDPERREFLKTTGIAAAAGIGGMILPFGKVYAAPPSNKNLKIAIIGGGVAGLACADVLIRQGYDPQVYEAQAHVGGRVASLRPNNLTSNNLDSLFGQNASKYLNPPGWNNGIYNKDSTGHFQTEERGGELIDTGHKAMIAYANEFNLPLEDYNKLESKGAEIHYYGIGNPVTPTVLSDDDVVEAFRDFVPIFRDEFRKLTPPNAILAEQGLVSADDKRLDNISISDFILQNGQDKGSVIYSMAEENYANEFGDEIDNLSSIAWLDFQHADRSQNFRPYGVFSDERYHVIGGNDLIPMNIGKRVDQGKQRIFLKHLLKEVSRNNSTGKTILIFKVGSQERAIEADVVVFTLPFSILRHIKGIGSNPGNSQNPGLQNNLINLSKVNSPVLPVVDPDDPLFENPLGLTIHKLRAIHLLDYGHSSKIHFAFNGPVWRNYGNNGLTFSDRDAWPQYTESHHNTTWESNHSKAIFPDDPLGRELTAMLTDYIGGERAIRIAQSGFDFQKESNLTLESLDLIYTKTHNLPPGSKPISDYVKKNNIKGKLNNVINAEPWYSNPFTKGSYTNNMPNYFMQIAEFEGLPDGQIAELFPDSGVGNWRIYFAGEHCSPWWEWQGFMEGGLLSGIRAANQIMQAIKDGKISI